MKRTIFLLMSILLLLTACGDGHKQTSSDKEQSEHKDNHNKNQVKQIATDKKVQGDNYRTILPLSLIHISEPTRRTERSRMPSCA